MAPYGRPSRNLRKRNSSGLLVISLWRQGQRLRKQLSGERNSWQHIGSNHFNLLINLSLVTPVATSPYAVFMHVSSAYKKLKADVANFTKKVVAMQKLILCNGICSCSVS